MASGLPTSTLGRTELTVTRLGYGAMELRGGARGRAVTESDAAAVLHAVLDCGITFIDTSPDYGVSEELIGRHLSERRSEFLLASKCGRPVGEAAAAPPSGGPPPHLFTRQNVIDGVEQSLRRMRTDYLDLVQFHGNPTRAQLEEHGALEALLELRERGVMRFVGASSTEPRLSELLALGVFDAFQIPYSALQRDHEAAIDAVAEAGAGTVIRAGVARGREGVGDAHHRDGSGHAAERVGARRTRRAAGSDVPHGVHAAVHAHAPRSADGHRRDDERRAPPRQRARCRSRATPHGPLRRGQAPSRRRTIGGAAGLGRPTGLLCGDREPRAVRPRRAARRQPTPMRRARVERHSAPRSRPHLYAVAAREGER